MANIIEAEIGVTIYRAVEIAQESLIKEGYFVESNLKFNDLLIPFSLKSDPIDIATIYNLMTEIKRLKR